MKSYDRITKNEERLNQVLLSIKNLDYALDEFQNNKENVKKLDKYYGSREWFLDKEKVEEGTLSNIKAGVLSEDSIWNMFEDIKDIINKMNFIIKEYEKE